MQKKNISDISTVALVTKGQKSSLRILTLKSYEERNKRTIS